MKFTYGDTVKVSEIAPRMFRPGEIASICEIINITTQYLSEYYKLSIGDVAYVIEFIDGSDVEIPEKYLELCPDEE